jgi:hypothetical protein
MDYVDRTFEGVTVPLDGNSYTNCTFRDVVLVFGGGDLHMANCDIDRFRFQFEGQLANGLHAIYQLFGTEGLIKIIRGFVDPAPGPVEI